MAIIPLAISIINIGFMLFVIFVQRRNSAATWAWVAAIALFPVFGFIVYLVFGQDSMKQRVFRQKHEDDMGLLEGYSGTSEGDITTNNQINLFHEGVTKFDSLLEDVANAEKFIFMQYYIFRGDKTGQTLINALAKKATQGVEVCLLVDGMGCQFTPKEIFQTLTDVGGKFALFMPPVPVRINFRNHRKIAVIDGCIAYLGGTNIGKEYLGKSERFGHWRDTHMRIDGEAVSSLTLRFIMDWNFAVSKKKQPKMQPSPKYFTASPQRFTKKTDMRMQIISSGPDTLYPNILHKFVELIINAEKSVYIQSPYFVPDDALYVALRIAALKGVDVRIMYPANPDHPFVYWAGSSYVGELMHAGVKGYEYTKGFLHAKTLMIDSKICGVGTANMDIRSFKINFETHAFIEDAKATAELEAAFLQDMESCYHLSLEAYKKRSKITKIKESVSRLFSPLI